MGEPTTGEKPFEQADFVVVTALEREAQAVVARLEGCRVVRLQERDVRTYHCGWVPIEGGEPGSAYAVAVVLLPRMGETEAAIAATDAIRCWQPRCVLLVGIAGGLPHDDLDLGDVVVAEQIVGYEYGKAKGKETEDGVEELFELRDRVYPVSTLLLDRVHNFWDDGWADEVGVARPAEARRGRSKRFVGPIASGNKVIASAAFRGRLKARWPRLLAVEMEGEGVMAAALAQAEIRHALVIRGVCDMADERKDDAWQEYAANAAAAYALALLRSGPVGIEGGARDGGEGTGEGSGKEAPRIALARLPSTSPALFGREQELALLDAAWDDRATNVVSLVAWGGVGKTALANRWLLNLREEDYRGAERVYGWSFYSQGAGEGRQASADLFIASALKWFGDPDPAAGSAWEKGERLAALVRGQRTLLVLDGLEPLQHPPGEMGGRLKDPALRCLLRGLARHNAGLCLLTTRLAVADLREFAGTSVERVELEHLSEEAGAALLADLGVKGAEGERRRAAGEFGGHALALALLGRYLAVAHGGDVRRRDRVGRLEEERARGGHARRVMAAYEAWFAGRPEEELLLLMGLFDRPAEAGALAALREPPAIAGLTERLAGQAEEDWRYAVAALRGAGLLAEGEEEGAGAEEALDCHPLVREHFAARLEAENPAAWREAHGRLYAHYAARAPGRPDTLEEMAPLYAAVGHGCRAGRHQEALREVYWRRIQRGSEVYSAKKLGAFGAELAALAGFFAPPWERAVDGLTDGDRAFVLNEAGFRLRALGRLAEAARPLQAGLEARVAMEDWTNAARVAGNLSELHLARGDVASAVELAQESVAHADRSGDAFLRMAPRTALAGALHQAGRLDEAADLFREAEGMQAERQPATPLLYSLRGYLYCDLLLERGAWGEAQRRAGQTLEWVTTQNWLLDIALDHLSLGRAHLARAQAERGGDLSEAATHLARAVDGLRRAGQQDELPRGLLARASLQRAQGAWERAQDDLDEAREIAARGGMQLFEADCCLEQCRLHLARGEREEAAACLEQGRSLVGETGYHRRDGEVEALERGLAAR